MRNILNLNENWLFVKNTTDIALREGESINLPHTWNSPDGYDGGNDYFRGTCLYVKTLNKSELPAADRYYLEIRGANSSADVYMDGKLLAHLNEVDDAAHQRMELLTRQMAEAQGVTEELKAMDQMAWVGAMNNIRNAADEIILNELIYI